VALRGAGRTDPARVDRGTWRRASIGLANVEEALRAAELERKRRLEAAKAVDG
jgi:hypothetical protein